MKLGISTRALYRISLPVMVACMHETIIDVANTAFLARYGVTEFGAIALGDAIYDLASCAAIGFSDAIQIIVARRMGQGKRRGAGKAFMHGLAFAAMFAVILCFVILYLSPFVTPLLVESDGVRAAVNDFLGIIAFAVLFHSANFAIGGFYLGIGRPRVLAWAAVLLAASNITLDYILIFGHFGAPELGIRGAALASLASETLVFVFLILWTLFARELRPYRVFEVFPFRASLARSLLRVSMPVAAEGFVDAVHWVAFFAILARLGERALGTANIVQECHAVLAIPLVGFSEATCTLTSAVIGQGRFHKILPLLRRATRMTYVFVAPIIVLVLVWPEAVLSIFTPDEEISEAAIDSLRVLAVALLAVTPGTLLSAAIAGTGDTRVALLLRIAFVFVALLFTWVVAIALGLPPSIVWLSEAIGWLFCMGPAHAWLRRAGWRKLAL